MESLYRTYRPQKFSDVVGQAHVVSTLTQAILNNKVAQAYLFCGPRGTGKTTMARLLAKALLCEQAPGVLPDGTCEECQAIAAGEHPDVFELDAASRTGVDNVREEIINRVDFAPTRGRYKVYIIDEVHMITSQAFNALLKTIEEPPSHVVFILCTTDPQTIPQTILSRVQRFDFKTISADEMFERLVEICGQENFTYEPDALDLIVRRARGGMRDAISTLEQLAVFCSGSLTLQGARDLLGETDDRVIELLIDALASNNVAQLFSVVENSVDAGQDLLVLLQELAGCLRDFYVASVCDQNCSIEPLHFHGENIGQQVARLGSSERISYMLQIVGDAIIQMKTASDQRLCCEIALSKIAHPSTELTLEALAARVAELERKLSSGGGAVTSAASQSVAAPAAVSSKPQPSPAPAQLTPGVRPGQARLAQAMNQATAVQTQAPQAQGTSGSSPAAKPIVPAASPAAAAATARTPTATQPANAAAAVSAASATTAAAAAGPAAEAASSLTPATIQSSQTTAVTDGGALQRKWKELTDACSRKNPSHASIFQQLWPDSDDGSKLCLKLPPHGDFLMRMLKREDVNSTLQAAVQHFFGSRQLEYLQDSIEQAATAAKPAPAPAPEPLASNPVAATSVASTPVTPAPTPSQASPTAAVTETPNQVNLGPSRPEVATAPEPTQVDSRPEELAASQPTQASSSRPEAASPEVPATEESSKQNYSMPWEDAKDEVPVDSYGGYAQTQEEAMSILGSVFGEDVQITMEPLAPEEASDPTEGQGL